jgi:hypothetical protein
MKTIPMILALSSVTAPVRAIECAELLKTSFGKEVKIESASLMAASSKLPAHCDVRGTIWPENAFAIKLPTEWNERFYMVGNGGNGGTINHRDLDNGVKKGYASASTNTGHDAAKEPQATFARGGSDNPNAERKVLDFGYLAVHETAVLAKRVIRAYYERAPRYSYWVGCSTGGRQGFSEAQRYPEDFDGLVIGAPAIEMAGLNFRNMWNAQVSRTGPGAIVLEKLPLISRALYEKCDAVDGLKDGLIDDPRQCAFEPLRDLPQCPTGTDRVDCFTQPQLEALHKIYDGPRDSAGRQLYPGQLPGAEIVEPAVNEVRMQRDESQVKYLLLDPFPGPQWTYRDFNFDRDPPRTVKNAAKINATNPDLRKLKKRGGKIVHFHGWGDSSVNAKVSVEYYESAMQMMGREQTMEFYRLFMVPGMYHCGSGVGCSSVDWLKAAIDWVEHGIAPRQLIGAHVENGRETRTRPICPYPEVARYKGSGNIDEAANFACTTPGRGAVPKP